MKDDPMKNKPVKSDRCGKCGSGNTQETPAVITREDGTTEVNPDTLYATCLNCGHEWTVVYYGTEE